MKPRTVVNTVLIDLGAWLCIILLLFALDTYLINKADSLQLPNSVADIPDEQVDAYASLFQSFYQQILWALISAMLLITALWSFSRGGIWAVITNTKLSKRYVLVSLALGFATALLAGGVILLATTFQQQFQLPVAFLLLTAIGYSSALHYLSYAKKTSLKSAFSLFSWKSLLYFTLSLLVVVIATQLLNTLMVGIIAILLFGGMRVGGFEKRGEV